MHGGRPVIGVAVAGFKYGRYSKYLPAALDKLYSEAISNPDLLDMAEHIALLETRIKEILTTLADGEPFPRWSQLAEVFGTFETRLLSGETEDMMDALAQVHEVLETGQKFDRAWGEILDTMEQLRKVADTEVKRKKELNQMIPVERVLVLMAAVGNAVKRNVSDPAEIDKVYRELAMLHGTDMTGKSSVLRVGAGTTIDAETVDAKTEA